MTAFAATFDFAGSWRPFALQSRSDESLSLVRTRPSTIGDPDWELRCVEAALAGNPAAFTPIVTHYSARVYTHVYRIVRSREEAEDLTQDTFLRAHRYLARFDASRPFRNWLYTIATNLALNTLRTRKRRGIAVSIEANEDGAAWDEPVSEVEDAAHRAERSELRDRLAAVIERLPARTASLVHLHYLEGMPIRDAGEIHGMNESAAKVAIYRARKQLREWLIETDGQV
jgi:RNA polymerase sigma-70 factor (ECF subfamily)